MRYHGLSSAICVDCVRLQWVSESQVVRLRRLPVLFGFTCEEVFLNAARTRHNIDSFVHISRMAETHLVDHVVFSRRGLQAPWTWT